MKTETIRHCRICVRSSEIVEIKGKRQIELIEDTDVHIARQYPRERVAYRIVATVKHCVSRHASVYFQQFVFTVLLFQVVEPYLLSLADGYNKYRKDA
jgi:hypothetical protein